MVMSVAFTPDGKVLASGDYDGIIKLWQMDKIESSRSLPGLLDSVQTIQFSPFSSVQMLATASSDNFVKLWDVTSGRILHTLSHSDVVTDIAFSADGQVLASTSRDRTVKLWDVTSGAAINTLKGNFRTVISISSDNQFLVTGDENGQIQIWQVSE